MNNVFVLNASPIILLGKADLLRTVSPLVEHQRLVNKDQRIENIWI